MEADRRNELIQIARSAMTEALSGFAPGAHLPGAIAEEAVTSCGGAFVTLRDVRRLRGCMGTFRPASSLNETIDRVARLACRDPRFVGNPVTADELRRLNIEISILGPLERTDDPLSLILGTHGILIRRGASSGCFLPHVATEAGWNVEQFLGKCCQLKADLEWDAWKKPDTDVLLFTADVFSEETPDS